MLLWIFCAIHFNSIQFDHRWHVFRDKFGAVLTSLFVMYTMSGLATFALKHVQVRILKLSMDLRAYMLSQVWTNLTVHGEVHIGSWKSSICFCLGSVVGLLLCRRCHCAILGRCHCICAYCDRNALFPARILWGFTTDFCGKFTAIDQKKLFRQTVMILFSTLRLSVICHPWATGISLF